MKDSFNSYPLGRPAQAGAIAAIADEEYFQRGRDYVIGGRGRLVAGLAARGFDVLPSAANFVFARHPKHAGKALAAKLRERAIIVRHFDALRITVGTVEQIEKLLTALDEIVT